MALPPNPGRLVFLWVLIGGILGGGIYGAFESLWVAIPAGFVVGFLLSVILEGRRRTREGPSGH